VLPWAKLTGAIVVGLLVFYFIPLGGGPGGFGFGPGEGGGAGLGAGKGGDKSGQTSPKDKGTAGEKKGPEAAPQSAVREPVEIELLGGDRYQGDQRFYLIGRTGPAKSLDEVKEYLDERHREKPLEVRIYLTKRSQSVGPNHPAFRRLDDLIRSYGSRDAQDHIPSTVISEFGTERGRKDGGE
jgi:hypothetical protein